MRVQGKEYGPVDLDELREWKREGRLIRENEIREPGSERWILAGELPEIFADEVAVPAPVPSVVRRLSFGEIFGASWRVYRQGFRRFFALALLVAVPAFFLQLAAPFLEMPKAGGPPVSVIVSAVVAFLMLMLLVIAWPFSLAGMQLLSADLYAGRDPGLGDVLTRAKPLWTRMFMLGLVVYGSYFLWTIIPLLVALSLAAGAASTSSLLLMLCLLVFTAYMVARLFINFLFWQQAGALGGRGGNGGATRKQGPGAQPDGTPPHAKAALSRRADRVGLVAGHDRLERGHRVARDLFPDARCDQC